MNWNRQLVWNSAWPVLSVGAVGVVLSALLSGGWTGPLCVGCVAVAGGLLTAAQVHRGQQAATARLRHPELSDTENCGGVFGDVTRMAVALLQQQCQELQQLMTTRGELEVASKLQKKQARRLDAALRAIDQPVILCDTRDHILFVNNPARQLGFTEEDSLAATVSHADRPHLTTFRQLVHDTRTRVAAARRRTAELNVLLDTQQVPFRAVVTTLFDDQNELLGTLAVLTDIRDEKTAKTKHAEFVSSVAHEFKTPMASIKAFLELLIDEDVTEPAEQKDLFEKIDFQVSRLNRMVGNLLNLARIEAGAVKVTRTDCDLNDVLQKSADVVKPLAEERGQQLVLDLSQLYLPVQADRDLLGQAIINLLSNAVKYTPEQGRITLRSQMLELEALVTVEDTGLGIPPDSLPKIFDRFYRVPEHQHSATGTGLGLAFVQTVVEDLHNGHISVESTVGKGSKFLVRIPLGHQQTHKRARKPEAVPEESAASV
jgi:two-component system phosphate regulon sensor histidine kinase PhoR